ncbi:MAG TPA: hypothetical protein VNT01_09990 [Symbiobacteriaceae bacterium]|nr:hypothetical protein [Symbiobacteriaceae bacterium]
MTSVYGERPMAGAPVSAPVSWEELEASLPRFSIRTIWPRLKEVGDMFAPILQMAQDLRRATAELTAML